MPGKMHVVWRGAGSWKPGASLLIGLVYSTNFFVKLFILIIRGSSTACVSVSLIKRFPIQVVLLGVDLVLLQMTLLKAVDYTSVFVVR